MKKVLVIANYFPPTGGGSVMRVAKFVKYLPEYGYCPVVLTAQRDEYIPLDEKLYDEVKNFRIYRVNDFSQFSIMRRRMKSAGGIESNANLDSIKTSNKRIQLLRALKYIKGVVENNFLIPDGSILWSKRALKKAIEIIKEDNIDLIFITSPPHSVQTIGKTLKQKFGNIPLVVDFRDAWTMNPLYKPPNIIKSKLEKVMEQSVIKAADKIVCATEVITNDYKLAYMDYSDKFITITNGFDSNTYDLDNNKYVKGDKLEILYTGGIGGKGRPAEFFLTACKDLIEEDKNIANVLRIKFIGSFLEDKVYWKKVLKENIEFINHMPQDEVIRHTRMADLLMLTFLPEQGGRSVLTGKIFEYLAAERPILGLVPESAAKDFIISNNLGYVAEPDNITLIKRQIKNAYDAWLNDNLFLKTDIGLIKKYDRRKLTKDLAEVFNSLYV